jgi:hypothetical protein
MKRMLIVALLAVGLAAVAGSISNRNKLVADGEPPPPFPPHPPTFSVPYTQRTMWLTADGEPPPPFPPKPPAESPTVA